MVYLFSVSYNEELSGLYGGVLQSQTEFAAACISVILDLYKSNRYTKSVPTSVILIGHSMVSSYYDFFFHIFNLRNFILTRIDNSLQ